LKNLFEFLMGSGMQLKKCDGKNKTGAKNMIFSAPVKILDGPA